MILAFNILIIIIALVILLYFLEKDLGLIILSFIILIQYIWMFFSISVIESGIYINEQKRMGFFSYSNLILLLFYLSTLISLIFYKKFFKVVFRNFSAIKFKLKPLRDDKLLVLLIGFILTIAYINLLLSPIPFFSNKVSKFSFWEFAKFPFLKPIVGNVMAFVGFGSMLLFKKQRKISVFFLLLYLSYLVLVGQKFTGFLIAFYGITLAWFYTSNKKLKFKIKWLYNKYLLSVLVILFFLVLYKYTLRNPFEYLGLSPVESVFYRAFGLQGHVFWGCTEFYIYNRNDNTWNFLEIWNGMHILMRQFWPWNEEAFVSVTSRGVSWTNAYPSILIRIFPLPIALIVNFFLFSIVGCFQSLLVNFIRKGSYVLSVIFFQLLMWVSYAFTMSYFSKLTIPFFILIIYMFFLFIKYKKNESSF